MLGIEQAGIAETIDFILNHYSADLQTALVQVRKKYFSNLAIERNNCLTILNCFLQRFPFNNVQYIANMANSLFIGRGNGAAELARKVTADRASNQ